MFEILLLAISQFVSCSAERRLRLPHITDENRGDLHDFSFSRTEATPVLRKVSLVLLMMLTMLMNV